MAELDDARKDLFEAIGLSQAQFADTSPNAPGLDSAALIKAIDTYTVRVRAELLDMCLQCLGALSLTSESYLTQTITVDRLLAILVKEGAIEVPA